MKNKKFIKFFTTLTISFVSLSSFLLSINYQNNKFPKIEKQNSNDIKTNYLIENSVKTENSLPEVIQSEFKLQETQDHVLHKVNGILKTFDTASNNFTKTSSSFLSRLFNLFSNRNTAFLGALYGVVGLAALSGLSYSVYKSIKDKNDRINAAKELEEDLKAKSIYTFEFKPIDPNKTGGKWRVFKYSEEKNNDTEKSYAEYENLENYIKFEDGNVFFEFKYKAKSFENNRLILFYEKDEKIKEKETNTEKSVYDSYSVHIYLWNFYDKNNKKMIDVYDNDNYKIHKKIGTLFLKEKQKTNEVIFKLSSR
ncbi:hypothetical protein [Mycoplasma phocimorsus]|uniref:hypothetical protein n=1 Tax=Mycoplasma phocimorsus TaxID=3045839 RepID=UPI0024C05679|nr:hypothetical protein [Mycoplasma phocimorsus]MDJ1647779.1 hypothetical protein [Mycoplasma phocimorsus]